MCSSDLEELIRVDADGGHSHAGSHNGDGYVPVSPGVALDATDIVDQLRGSQEGFRDELRAEGVAGHEDSLREIAGFGGIVRRRHSVLPFCVGNDCMIF